MFEFFFLFDYLIFVNVIIYILLWKYFVDHSEYCENNLSIQTVLRCDEKYDLTDAICKTNFYIICDLHCLQNISN